MVKISETKENVFKEIFLDEDFKTSSKRIIGIVGFILIAFTFGYNIFYQIPMEYFVWNGMIALVASVFGFSALQSGLKKRNK